MSHPQAQAPSVAATASTSARSDIEWRLWLPALAVFVCASLSATVIQLASKRNASAALDPSGGGQIAYAAGWPLAFAHLSRNRLSAADWNQLVGGPPPLKAIAPLAFIADVAILAAIFAAVLGLAVWLWWLVLRPQSRAALPRAQLGQAATTGLAIAASWYVLAASIITIISRNVATDSAVREQITRPLALAALAPGVAGYAVQRWLETDRGPAIALTGGPAGIVDVLAALVIGIVLPAGALALLATFIASRRARPTP
jgi:hypothetical protein